MHTMDHSVQITITPRELRLLWRLGCLIAQLGEQVCAWCRRVVDQAKSDDRL